MVSNICKKCGQELKKVERCLHGYYLKICVNRWCDFFGESHLDHKHYNPEESFWFRFKAWIKVKLGGKK